MARTKEKVSEYNSRYRLLHHEAIAVAHKDWYETNIEHVQAYNKKPKVKEKRRLCTQRWRARQPRRLRPTVTLEQKRERARLAAARWYKNHKDLHRKRVKDWKQRNPENVSINRRMQKVRRRAAINGAEINQFTKQEWFKMQGDYDHRCAYCWLRRSLTQDHVIPLSKGGIHHASNIVPACRSCNSKKGDRV